MERPDSGTPRPVTATRILMVDDDLAMQRLVATYLGDHGVEVSVVANRDQMTALLKDQSFGLVILDLNLGPEDGLDLLRELRNNSDLPVIIVTGHRRDEIDRVVGLELGADDYLTKPFSLRELLARIRVVLRRAEHARELIAREAAQKPQPDQPAGRRTYRFGGWTLDQRTRQLHNPDGKPVVLTNGEHALLTAFLDAPQRPLSREQLLQATRMHEDIYDRSIDVQILRLRRKLATGTDAPQFIQTERGFGYVFAVAVERV